MKNVLIWAGVLCLCGCCSTEKYSELLNKTLGMPESQLVEALGNPSSVYEADGKKYLEYSVERPLCNQYGCNKYWCKTQYTIEDGVVSYWSAKGNSCCIR